MGIATPPPLLPPIFSQEQEQSISTTHKPNSANSMSQDYHHQGIFSFSNGFERSTQQEQQQQQQQQHIAQQIRRDKLRVQGYEPPPPLVAIDEEESGGLNPVYETAGMLSEMFNFPPGAELLEQQQIPQNYHRSPQRPQPPPAAASNMEWYRQGMATVGGLGPLDISSDSKNHHHHHHQQQHNQNINNRQISNINAESAAAAMQLFLMNPPPRSPSPPPPPATSSTLHMLLPNPSSNSLQGFHQVAGSVIQPPSQFTWVPDSTGDHHEGSHTHSSAASQLNKFGEIGGVVEGQGLSLSLSSSLQHLEAAKAEELRMGDGTAAAMLFFNQGGSGAGAGQSSSSSHNYPFNKNIQHHQSMHNLQGGTVGHQNHQQVHVGFGSSIGVVNVMRNSRYVKAAQELLEEFCSVGRGQFKKNKFGARQNNTNPNSNQSVSVGGGGGGSGGGGSSSSSKDLPPLSASDRIEHQRRKVKLLSMLDEVDRRYNHYCEQMQMVVNSFDLVMGFGAAVPYTALAQKAMSRHFRCLKDAISAQLKHSYEVLGEKDGAGTSGVTKGETPRLRMLEQSLRQQRAFHQMGMMEQEAWRPQRGLPERSVNILRAWLFEHFLHPYPSDADKHLLARQTGLSRNQVSNWFINARVRLWKPMVEEMYQQESKEDDQDKDIDDDDDEEEERERSQSSSGLAQTPTPTTTTTTTTTASATGKRSEINATESDPSSLIAINRHCFSENQAKQAAPPNSTTTTNNLPPPISQCFGSTTHESQLHHHHHHHNNHNNNNNRLAVDDTCRRGSISAAADHYGTTSAGGNGNGNVHHADIGSTLIRFGTTAGDVSLTLGLRHAGNMAGDKPFFS